MQVEKGIVFHQVDGYRALELDIYRPDAASSPLPLLHVVHGGGWRVSHRGSAPRETRGWEHGFFERLTDAGFVVAASTYRYSSEAHFPAQIDDTKAALAWLRENGANYGADVERIAVMGASAGGQLVSLLALDPANGPIRGVVCWYPIADFSVSDQDATDSFEAHLFGGPIRDNLELAKSASPTTYVHSGAPPFHFAHGTDDQMASFEHSVRMVEALTAEGVNVSFRKVEGGDHFYAGREEEVESIFDETVEFIQRVTS